METSTAVAGPHQGNLETSRPWPVWLAALVGLLLTAGAFWPGIMIDDARWQYQQSVDNAYEDWHPPIMAWLWRQLSLVLPGPGLMLALQLLLAWGGMALIGGWAKRRGWKGAALGVVAAGFLPGALMLMGAVTKDCLMAGTLLAATGLLLWLQDVRTTHAGWLLRTLIFALLLFAAALRFNAFLACLPLALAAVPASSLASWPRRIGAALLFSAAFLAVGPAVSSALHAEKTGVQQSLIIFDLGGITAFSGQNVFPDLGVRDPVAVNARCYDPYQWDTYSDWAKVPCPLGYDAIQPLVDDEDIDPKALWIDAIRHHPLAYAEHRLAHFNQATYFLIRHSPGNTGWLTSVDNPWHYQVTPNPVLDAVGTADRLVLKTPLGWPIIWLALALAALVGALALRVRGPALALAASAFLYGSGYLLVGVATGMRYQLWTWFAAIIAALFVWAEWRNSQRGLPRWLPIALILLVLVPAALGLGARTG
ncbi:hypothetical protein M8312_00525 [Sphingomonas sp. KRR8]|uniref:hypothetical protein n=1 Tax=Sphingomonas sp. KRR8 TaxID=2942996 RepID=UPI0020216D69|nr:hypothetical protein [Sphingomonas sp. KRR8]URD61040.1 hypothetical protein M8312_00525 [Sphingomonas sp. KRR8]